MIGKFRFACVKTWVRLFKYKRSAPRLQDFSYFFQRYLILGRCTFGMIGIVIGYDNILHIQMQLCYYSLLIFLAKYLFLSYFSFLLIP